jgi:hypothetical protein
MADLQEREPQAKRVAFRADIRISQLEPIEVVGARRLIS